MVHGDGLVGDYLVRREVDHICFTGSAEIGMYIRKVAAESWHKTTSCEMGSKSACIVFDDADLDLALEAAFASAFKLSGQRCVSSGRLIVQRKIYKEFAQKIAEMAKNVKIGNPFDKNLGSCGTPAAICWENLVPNNDITYGPLINKQGEDNGTRLVFKSSYI